MKIGIHICWFTIISSTLVNRFLNQNSLII